MNLDRLLKLLKLANHNPNDAEANSAARAACKILGEENYKWLESIKKNSPVAQPVDASGARTWNDVHHSTEPFWRSTRPTATEESESQKREQWERARQEYERGRTRPPPPKDPNTGEPFNPFSDENYWQQKYDEANKKARETKKERERRKWTQTGNVDGDIGSSKRYKKVYKQVCRDCTVCKITRLTTDEETPYVCYSCRTRG